MLDKIPQDILERILPLLPLEDCLNLRLVSRQFSNLVLGRMRDVLPNTTVLALSTAHDFSLADRLGIPAARVQARDLGLLAPIGNGISTLHIDMDGPMGHEMIRCISALTRLTELGLISPVNHSLMSGDLAWKLIALELLPQLPAQVKHLRLVNDRIYGPRAFLPAEFREPFAKLKSISLRGFENLYFSPPLFSTSCVDLEELHLHAVKELPSCIGQLPNLKVLDVSACGPLGPLFGTLTLLTSLTRLELKGCSLASLPNGLGASLASHLVHLDLAAADRIQPLPWADLSLLTRLTYLNLSRLRMHHRDLILDDAFATHPHLVHLDLSYNKTSRLPASVCQLSRLQSLCISSMALTVLPDGLGNLTALTELTSRLNPLVALPSTLTALANLKTACFTSADLGELRAATWQGLTRLETLDLARSKIRACEHAVLSCLGNLRSLDLSYNALQHLPPTISSLTRLTRLDVGDNLLANVSMCDGLGELTQLRELHLVQEGGSTHSLLYTSSFSRLTNLTNMVPLQPSGGRLRFKTLLATTRHTEAGDYIDAWLYD